MTDTQNIPTWKLFWLKWKAKSARINRGSVNFRTAKQATLFYHLPENSVALESEIDSFKAYLEQAGKQVTTVVVYPLKDTKVLPVPTDRNRWNFCLADFNMVGYPKNSGLLKILGQPTDLFICLDLEVNLRNLAAGMLANSPAKVGFHGPNNESVYDILLKQTETPNLNQYLCDIKEFFKRIQ